MLCYLQMYHEVIQLHVYMNLLSFRSVSHIGYYRVLSKVPCALQ